MTKLFGYCARAADDETQHRMSLYANRVCGIAGEPIPALTWCGGLATRENNGLIIGISGKPRILGLTAANPSTDELLRRLDDSFRCDGIRALDKLDGSFSLAILRPADNFALIAIDRMGIERLAYTHSRNLFAFGSSVRDVGNFPGIDLQLRNQALYDFLFMHMIPSPQTVYEHIFKLPPATAVIFDGTDTRQERYWTPRYSYTNPRPFNELKAELQDSIAEAVLDVPPDRTTGAFLSGGLDSSTIAGFLASLSKTPTKAFTVGFGEAKYDELRFSRIAARHFGLEAIEYQMSPKDIVEAIPKIAAAYDEPFGNSSAVPTYFCARLAASHGISHLLAGDGGDELFAGNERYLRQSAFELYYRLPPFLRQKLVEPAATRIPENFAITPLRKLRSYVDQALIPLPDRFESWNFMYREGGADMLDSAFRESIDRNNPIRLMRETWEFAPTTNLLDRMLWYDWKFTLADNDLRKVKTMCELAGVDVSFPLLDQKIVNLSTEVPPSMKISGTNLRSFFKRALKGFLPNEVIQKKKQGFASPFGVWLKNDDALRELIYSHLTNLKGRHIVDRLFIDNLLHQHRSGHASYFGYVIWDLAMLEAWLAHHRD